MPKVTLVIREVGKLNPEYSLEFDLPAIPTEGSYISVQRPGAFAEHGEDFIVKRVWWRLFHPDMGHGSGTQPKVGSVKEIFVECVQAIGPWSSDRWRDRLEFQRNNGKEVPELEVARLSVREDSFNKK